MTINLQSGGYVPVVPTPQALPGARSADTQVRQKQVQQDPVIPAPQVPQPVQKGEAQSPEERRYEQVVQAARSAFRDFYPVGDKTFTIFKDASGQYITRYRSLRDGRVTYIPEERLLRAAEPSRGSGQAVVTIVA